MGFDSVARATYWLVPGWLLFLAIHLLGIGCFIFIAARRLAPLVRAQRDLRFNRPLARVRHVLRYWLGQWRHPRFPLAGTIHILIFSGFIILATRALSVLGLGISDALDPPSLPGAFGRIYDTIRDYATTIVFLAVTVAAFRRMVFKPARYAVPGPQGSRRAADAIFLLGLTRC